MGIVADLTSLFYVSANDDYKYSYTDSLKLGSSLSVDSPLRFDFGYSIPLFAEKLILRPRLSFVGTSIAINLGSTSFSDKPQHFYSSSLSTISVNSNVALDYIIKLPTWVSAAENDNILGVVVGHTILNFSSQNWKQNGQYIEAVRELNANSNSLRGFYVALSIGAKL